jgi:hypothetical protein
MRTASKLITVLRNLLRDPLLAARAIRALNKSGVGQMKHVLYGRRYLKMEQQQKHENKQQMIANLLEHGKQHRAMLLPHPILHEEKQEFYAPVAISEQPRVFAYYHPAFYQTEFNDKAWGKGFTEWTSVLSGSTRFDGHYQPRIPLNYNFYDQSDESTVKRQIDLAKGAGISGMIFYSYFSDGEVRFEKPLSHFRSQGSMPWLSMWCNHNWNKRWDGSESEVIWPQGYESDELLVDFFAEQFSDPMYEKILGRPMFIVYSAQGIPGGASQIANWRALFRERHQSEPIILAIEFGELTLAAALTLGFDGLAGHSDWRQRNKQAPVAVNEDSKNAISNYVSYEEYLRKHLARERDASRQISASQPDWDNDARYNDCGRGFVGSTPALYQEHLSTLCRSALGAPFLGCRPYVFINAWNEWAEGAYLEPDLHYGYAYLNATARAISRAARS